MQNGLNWVTLSRVYPPLQTKDPTLVQAEVQDAYCGCFGDADRLYVPRVFGWAIECFTGGYRDYQPIDAKYHDFEHTLQGTLCMLRLLRNRHRAGAQPVIHRRGFELGLVAILLHDTGYLKRRGDTGGTGAKYTLVHVTRSTEFAALLLGEKGWRAEDIRAVQNMIRCTGVNVDLKAIPFQDEVERLVGYALGTADLLGQMAAEDYTDKLPILYQEFAESAQFNGTKNMFESAADLVRKTPGFWQYYVLPKITKDFLSIHEYLRDPYPSGSNSYVARVEANIARLQAQPVPA